MEQLDVLSHLKENLCTLDFNLSPEEWKELETAIAAIPVVSNRYNAEQQKTSRTLTESVIRVIFSVIGLSPFRK